MQVGVLVIRADFFPSLDLAAFRSRPPTSLAPTSPQPGPPNRVSLEGQTAVADQPGLGLGNTQHKHVVRALCSVTDHVSSPGRLQGQPMERQASIGTGGTILTLWESFKFAADSQQRQSL